MQNNEMTPSEAIIVLDRLNTSERIEVDRDELRAAVKIAKDAIGKNKIPRLGNPDPLFPLRWCPCGMSSYKKENKYCNVCGQALKWREV